MRIVLLCLSLLLTASPAAAQDAAIGLSAPAAVTESGLLSHILPRFSLKTGIRVVADPNGVMVLSDAAPGTPVFRGGGVTFYLRIDATHTGHSRFRDWMISDIGKRTIDNYQPDGVAVFDTNLAPQPVTVKPIFNGDAARGADLALTHCGRCHVISETNKMNGLGSTPSFAALRGLPNWDDRFQSFYVLNPHGAFTQITDVTLPFDPERPPPIVPVRITLDELEAILAFVATVQPADLGAPLHTQ